MSTVDSSVLVAALVDAGPQGTWAEEVLASGSLHAVESLVASSVSSDQFDREYGRIFEGDEKWKSMPAPTGTLFHWDGKSTYVREPPYFIEFGGVPPPPSDIAGARVLAVLGDSITTDHISPAGSITVNSPAGKYLVEQSVRPPELVPPRQSRSHDARNVRQHSPA